MFARETNIARRTGRHRPLIFGTGVAMTANIIAGAGWPGGLPQPGMRGGGMFDPRTGVRPDP